MGVGGGEEGQIDGQVWKTHNSLPRLWVGKGGPEIRGVKDSQLEWGEGENQVS